MNKINFENLPSTNTPLSAENLNLMQDNIEDAISNSLIDAKDYTDTKGITESGSNANGSYIKYDDGTMICYIYKGFNLNITKQFEGVYYENSGDILFPQEFISTPIINITARGLAGGGYSFYTIENNKFSGFIWKTQSKSDANLWLMITAYGRWK